MDHGHLLIRAAVPLVSLLLAACGGGNNNGETTPSTPPTSTTSGLDRFLLFPNPQQIDGSPQTDETAYARAYYAAIDPENSRDTLAKWKAKNGFDAAAGTRVTVAFGDQRDLGYGRRMTAWRNADGTIAFVVENYQVDPGGAYGYSSVSLEAAAREDTRWRILVNAIEFSPGPAGGASFAKFFNFNPETGERELSVDLDGRGPKAMPGPCITCHGGRGDALTPDANGKLLFNLVQNTASNARGDVQAHLAPLEVDRFDFLQLSGFTKSEQEAKLKTMNMYVLCSYPLPPSAPAGVAASFCTRRPAIASEWQGTAADLLIQSYGGDGLPQSTYSDTVVPLDWKSGGQADLYANVVAPSCRGCHILRGTLGQSDIDFTTLAKFQGFAKTQLAQDPPGQALDDRIKVHVIDRGDMPLAKFIYDTFWKSPNPGPDTLAAFLEGRGFTLSRPVVPPGRPIADPGPDRLVTRGQTTLSAAASLYTYAYRWSILTGPDGATLTNADTARPTFNATQDGTYVLQLVAINGSVQSTPASVTLVVQGAGPPKRIVFADIKGVLGASGSCASCHRPGGSSPGPPVFFADSGATGATDRTDDAVLYAEVRSRINFTDIVASPLLRKPSGRHHNGNLQLGFDTTQPPGNAARANYDLFLNWILNGAPMI